MGQEQAYWSDSRYAEHGLRAATKRAANPSGPRDVASLLDAALARDPLAIALVDREGEMTYAGLEAAVRAATALFHALGLKSGSRIAATGRNCNALIIAFLASQRLGAIWVGIARALAPPERRHLLEDCAAEIYLADFETPGEADALVQEVASLRHAIGVAGADGAASQWTGLLAQHSEDDAPRLPPIDPWAPAAIAYTSGTTGFPKGVVHSQHNIVVTAAVSVAYSGDGVPETVRGTALPLTILNLMILGPVAALMTGAPHVALDRVDAAGVAEWIGRLKIANISLVPTVVRDLLMRPDIDQDQLTSLAWLVVGGAAVPPELPAIYEARFGKRMTIGYGLTEGPNGVAKTHEGSPEVAGVIGRPLPHLRMAILDPEGRELPRGTVGEIAVGAAESGPWAGVYTPALGYWNAPEATAKLLAGGWLHTGDVGLEDDMGEFHIRDRGSDLILRGGANVYPAEVERVLREHGGVRDCAVLGQADDRLGQVVVAFVEAAEDPGIDLSASLAAHCAANLAAYKIPASFHILPALPRNSMGKVVKGDLARRLEGEAPPPA